MFNKQITKSQIAAIHVLLHRHNLQDEKRTIIEEISGGRCSSTTQLTYEEARQWIAAMNKGQKRPETNLEQDVKRQRMINSIIAMAREMGVIKRVPVVGDAGQLESKSDYSQFNQWLLTKSCVKKSTLNDVQTSQLPELVTQYKNIYQSWLQKHH